MRPALPRPEFHFGYDVANREFILWKRGRRTPVARIPFTDAQSLAKTLHYVAEQDRKNWGES